MDPGAAAYAHIRQQYFGRDKRAGRALRLFDAVAAGRSRRNLARLLRHHDDGEISDSATHLRDDFDFLLAFFSMVEVACIAGVIPSPLPEDHRSMARRILGHVAVWQYYVENYALVLPELHLYRAQGVPVAAESADASLYDLFASFFSLTWRLETDEDLDTFLWFLDGGERNGKDIDDTISALNDPSRAVRLLTGEPSPFEGWRTLAESVRGFVKFVRMAEVLEDMLERCPRPLVRSAMWAHHSYWIERLHERFGARLVSAIDVLTDGGPPVVRRKGSSLRRLAGMSRAASAQYSPEPVRRESRGAETLRALALLGSGRHGWLLKEVAVRWRYDLGPGFDPGPENVGQPSSRTVTGEGAGVVGGRGNVAAELRRMFRRSEEPESEGSL